MRRSVSFLAPMLMIVMSCALLSACDGDDDGGGVAPSRQIACSQSPVALNNVALVCGNQLGNQVMQIKAVIGGPSTAVDIKGFNFVVEFEETLFSYVAGSAEIKESFLKQSGNMPLLLADLESTDPGRLVISVHRTSPADGVQAAGMGENLILAFEMEANSLSANIDPMLLTFDNTEAVSPPVDDPIGGIVFSNQILLSVQ